MKTSLRARLSVWVLSLALVGGVILTNPLTATATHVIQNGWDLNYGVPVGDGVPITSAFFNGTRVFSRASLPYVHVTYDGLQCCVDHFGPEDEFFDVIGPAKTSVTGGFTIRTTYCFGPCGGSFSYKYIESYTFLSSGEWTAQLEIYGPGLQPSHMYDVFWRVDYDISAAAANTFSRFNAGAWVNIATEQEYVDDLQNAAGGFEWRQTNGAKRYQVNPLSFPTAYKDLVVAYHSGENGGAGVLGQFPDDLYDNNEAIASADLVQWYHGIRNYTRPASCMAGGAGCTTPFIVGFTANPVGF